MALALGRVVSGLASAEVDKLLGHMDSKMQEYFASDEFQKECKAAFEKNDANKNGVLDGDELAEAVQLALPEEFLQRKRDQLHGENLNKLIMAFDVNCDGKISMDEFVEFLKWVYAIHFKEFVWDKEGHVITWKADFTELFGETLLTKSGVKPTREVLSGKSTVAIYFSAHWCPPCRRFTPEFAKMYSQTFSSKGMEVVFASSDRDESAFTEYYAEMPWAALPFDKRDVKEMLSKKFKVRGIPSLVILGPDGKTITQDGTEAVMKDPTGEKYPWIPPTAAEKAKMVLDILGPEAAAAKDAGRAIGIYFSAHWCPPCRGFTPKLAEFYKSGLKDKMEIFFVSSDKDQNAFDEYFAEMPWRALPYEKREEKDTLSDAFGVNGIPCFVALNGDGTVITTDGRSQVMQDPTGETLPNGWLPQPFNDVNKDPDDLNNETCVIALGGDEAMCAAVKTVALEYFDKAGKHIDEMPFRFFSGPDGGVVSQLRNLVKIPQGCKLLLLDIPDDGGFYVCQKGTDTPEAVREFLGDYNAKKLERQQLQK